MRNGAAIFSTSTKCVNYEYEVEDVLLH
jgi:hypothetical protein